MRSGRADSIFSPADDAKFDTSLSPKKDNASSVSLKSTCKEVSSAVSVTELSNEDLAKLADDLRARQAVRSRVLSKLILNEARRQGGFSLGNVWRNEKLHAYSFREILAGCKELEDQGRLQWRPDGSYGVVE